MVDSQTRESNAERAAELLTSNLLFQNSQHIACYMATPEEFDCAPIVKKIWQAKKSCYLPVLSSNNTLVFACYRNKNKLVTNRYSILEPFQPEVFSPEKLDIVLLPLVAFDLEGNRLGMGAGYYDRTFAFKQNNKMRKPFLLGVGYECQKVENIISDDWDVKLDGMLTEKKLYLV